MPGCPGPVQGRPGSGGAGGESWRAGALTTRIGGSAGAGVPGPHLNRLHPGPFPVGGGYRRAGAPAGISKLRKAAGVAGGPGSSSVTLSRRRLARRHGAVTVTVGVGRPGHHAGAHPSLTGSSVHLGSVWHRRWAVTVSSECRTVPPRALGPSESAPGESHPVTRSANWSLVPLEYTHATRSQPQTLRRDVGVCVRERESQAAPLAGRLRAGLRLAAEHGSTTLRA